MKISKMGKNKWFKWIVIVVVCYLLASLGVNGVVNPVRYFNAGTVVALPTAESGEYLLIDLTDVTGQEGYINISVKEMAVFQVTAESVCNFSGGQSATEKLRINDVLNCYKVSSWGENVENIAISKGDLEDAGVEFDEIFWSETRQVNTGKMVVVFISFVCLMIFRECMQFIKIRYSK